MVYGVTMPEKSDEEGLEMTASESVVVNVSAGAAAAGDCRRFSSSDSNSDELADFTRIFVSVFSSWGWGDLLREMLG